MRRYWKWAGFVRRPSRFVDILIMKATTGIRRRLSKSDLFYIRCNQSPPQGVHTSAVQHPAPFDTAVNLTVEFAGILKYSGGRPQLNLTPTVMPAPVVLVNENSPAALKPKICGLDVIVSPLRASVQRVQPVVPESVPQINMPTPLMIPSDGQAALRSFATGVPATPALKCDGVSF